MNKSGAELSFILRCLSDYSVNRQHIHSTKALLGSPASFEGNICLQLCVVGPAAISVNKLQEAVFFHSPSVSKP